MPSLRVGFNSNRPIVCSLIPTVSHSPLTATYNKRQTRPILITGGPVWRFEDCVTSEPSSISSTRSLPPRAGNGRCRWGELRRRTRRCASLPPVHKPRHRAAVHIVDAKTGIAPGRQAEGDAGGRIEGIEGVGEVLGESETLGNLLAGFLHECADYSPRADHLIRCAGRISRELRRR